MMATEQARRVRSSKARDQRARAISATIVSEWQRAIERSLPANEVFARCSDMIRSADLTVGQKQDLRARNWGCRDLTERTQSVWQLYLDGVRVARVDAYHDGAWLELSGRLEWRASGEGYYTSDAPSVLMVRENGVLRSISE